MLLHLKDGREVEIFRQNCGYFFKDRYKNYPDINWNISPIDHINEESKGFFVIAPWGSLTGRDQCGRIEYYPEKIKELIPVRSVISVSKIDEWEKTGKVP